MDHCLQVIQGPNDRYAGNHLPNLIGRFCEDSHDAQCLPLVLARFTNHAASALPGPQDQQISEVGRVAESPQDQVALERDNQDKNSQEEDVKLQRDLKDRVPAQAEQVTKGKKGGTEKNEGPGEVSKDTASRVDHPA